MTLSRYLVILILYFFFYLVPPGVEIHDKILGLGVPVPHFALVAVGVPGHLVGHVAVLLVLGYQLVVLGVLCGPALQRRPQHHRGFARPEMCCRSQYIFISDVSEYIFCSLQCR